MEIKLQEQKVVDEVKEQIILLKDESRIKVVSLPTLDKANAQLQELKTIKKSIQEKKDTIVKPLNEALKNVRALFKPFEDDIETIETYLKSQVLEYNKKLIEERKKQEEEIQKNIQDGKEISSPIKKIDNIEERIGKIKTRKIKKLQINDISKIPLNYLIPNEVLIRQDLLNGVEIPGCEMVEEEIATL